MRFLILATVCLFATSAFADEQPRLRDNSLSPAETLKEPDIKYQHDPFVPAGASQISSNQSASGSSASGSYSTTNHPPSLSSGKYMSSYCDSNFKSAVALSPAMQACMANGHKQACERFRVLPADAKDALDHVIGCAMANEVGEDTHGNLNCIDNDDNGRILKLVKKYWQDQDTLYTLIFLPDIVIGASDTCLTGGRQ